MLPQAGYIFDIQRYSVHDGPGIRTTVFVSGCPLRCLWCQNPESYEMKPQVAYRSDACAGCGRCVAACPQKAIARAGDKVRTDRGLCAACGGCVKACPAEARSLIGRRTTAEATFEEVASDKIFYDDSGGGLTISGGEALFQPKFSARLLRLCREGGIHTAVETSGYAEWSVIREVLGEADLVLFDLKHADSAAHVRGTGIPNGRILKNAERIVRELGKPLVVRIPVVPGFNASEADMAASARFVSGRLGASTRVNLLPYHRLGIGKRERLERDLPDFAAEPPSEEAMRRLQGVFAERGVKAEICG